MNTRIPGLAASLAPITDVSGSADAAEPHGTLPQVAWVATDPGSNASALTDWVDEADGLHVVATIHTIVGGTALPEPDRHAVVRFPALTMPKYGSLPGSPDRRSGRADTFSMAHVLNSGLSAYPRTRRFKEDIIRRSTTASGTSRKRHPATKTNVIADKKPHFHRGNFCDVIRESRWNT